MKIILILGSFIVPAIMVILKKKWDLYGIIFNIIAIVSALTFGNIASIAIYQIIKDNTVFMTNIHALFLNPFFLLTGAYLGIYLVYSLILRSLE